MELGFRRVLEHLLVGFWVRLSHKYWMASAFHGAHDLGHLPGRFALTEDNLRPAGPQGPVVVQFGEIEVLVRQVAQLLQSGINSYATLFEPGQ